MGPATRIIQQQYSVFLPPIVPLTLGGIAEGSWGDASVLLEPSVDEALQGIGAICFAQLRSIIRKPC